jgi:hypothetical protein
MILGVVDGFDVVLPKEFKYLVPLDLDLFVNLRIVY